MQTAVPPPHAHSPSIAQQRQRSMDLMRPSRVRVAVATVHSPASNGVVFSPSSFRRPATVRLLRLLHTLSLETSPDAPPPPKCLPAATRLRRPRPYGTSMWTQVLWSSKT